MLILCCSALYADHPHSTAQDFNFQIRGFDVSHHQGAIDWSRVSPQQYQFVYLKATEGADYTDPRFQAHWLAARERGLYVGAYHFFRFCSSSAERQAQHFIATVPKKNNALPPVIDVEYDSRCMAQLTRQQVLQKMRIMQKLLQQHYEKQPIFYSSAKFYTLYLQQHFAHAPIWLQDFSGNTPAETQIVFWQYSRQGKISAIQGTVDLNLFLGNNAQWQHFLQHNSIEMPATRQ
ncbi:hypothetical protein BFG52_15955 [Acinetobacter larvae]|uniref:Lysozyme n=2 Tax=Acinetobacter larvae TaxID=1789224 RepID=A0A1B2M4D8_9GAMM|nr:hypothetical protein BFG52_15955 [Acinetobacter larvae]